MLFVPFVALLGYFLSLPLRIASEATKTTKGHAADYNPCGTVVTDEDIINADKAISRMKISRQLQLTTPRTYKFDVHFNVVAANMTEEGGWIPQSQLDAQIELLNERYTGTGVSFRLANVTRILSRYWHETVGVEDTASVQTSHMHRLFRVGGSADLNVFTVGFYDSDINGYSTLPVNYFRTPTFDGVVLRYSTMPGGSSPDRQGGTLIHEAGHWLGLRHTFQGGCTGVGDGVADTPPQAKAQYGCPIGADTCAGGGLDAIHNYMDYTDEDCRTEFTKGQIELMQYSITAFRV